MLKSLFTLPDTFDPDDRRRRQFLHILLLVFIMFGVIGLILTFLIVDHLFEAGTGDQDVKLIIFPTIILVIISGLLLVLNRSAHMPGWLSATLLIALLMIINTQIDTPLELYNGRSLITWTLPILLGAIILRPGSVFAIAAIVFGLMEVFTPPASGGVNYYAIGELMMIAFMSWLGMTIANRAIHDARNQAANLQAIYDHVADGVLVLDLQGRFLSANLACWP